MRVFLCPSEICCAASHGRTRSVLGGIPKQSVGTISVISGTPIMLMLALSVIPKSCCNHGYVLSQTFLF